MWLWCASFLALSRLVQTVAYYKINQVGPDCSADRKAHAAPPAHAPNPSYALAPTRAHIPPPPAPAECPLHFTKKDNQWVSAEKNVTSGLDHGNSDSVTSRSRKPCSAKPCRERRSPHSPQEQEHRTRCAENRTTRWRVTCLWKVPSRDMYEVSHLSRDDVDL